MSQGEYEDLIAKEIIWFFEPHRKPKKKLCVLRLYVVE
jgi:hypothetical protein